MGFLTSRLKYLMRVLCYRLEIGPDLNYFLLLNGFDFAEKVQIYVFLIVYQIYLLKPLF
jgi:hypothetical protein